MYAFFNKTGSVKKIVIAYIPVLHEGYRAFLDKHADADEVFIFGETLIKKYDYLAKEIRQLSPELIKKAIESWGLVKKISVLEAKDVSKFTAEQIVMPDEDVCKDLAGEAFKSKKVTFDSVFLRWDKHKSMEEKPVQADQKISCERFDREVISKLKVEAEKSSDWWRRIGAALIDNGKIISIAHNNTVPAKHLHYTEGDPRNSFHKGVQVELSTIFHAEASLIAWAAREGRSLVGTSIYVTVFPCPPCAKLLAYSGITKLYYGGGYQMLDQERVLRAKGIEIIYVEPEK
ncbi:MAG: hypothetical protein A3C06_04455 [Candidatus Taylorbacteria bacterium RIFCSPHIGHO2_02_FULL_46_13]|uniref:CMP/dCMP-type deaminase domain-containing protein n=1 Tax=Candidatus Taylorbacteria bacterium RIFCSPHIGHO2_02_FULL_46_13 TaxID=1802312 RepID=A0A1G2MSW8_9BACT|nr:MAG: hypothetical protein A3C06_04455 [Candidatus Taylorbacteria bacterium RIFCSPHIGHO2_02_FULL_46_13]